MRFLEAVKSRLAKYFTSGESLSISDPDFRPDENVSNPRAYRPLTQSPDRGLPAWDHDRMLELASYMYFRNSFAHRTIELLNDFIVGEGYSYKTGHPAVQEALDVFWRDPENNWDLSQVQLFKDLSIFGELCLTVHVDNDGYVRYGVIDPAQINSIERDKYNARKRLKVHFKLNDGVQPPPLDIVHTDLRPNSPTAGLLIGSENNNPACFFFTINGLSISARGYSDLTTLIDPLDLLDQFLHKQAERAVLHSGHIWDVTLTGLDEDQQREWFRKNAAGFVTGKVRCHNENVQINTLSPAYQGPDIETFTRVLQLPALAGHGIPQSWFVTGMDANLATAQAQQLPILKYLSKRQKEFKGILKHILCYVRDQAIIAGRIPRTLTAEELDITIQASEVNSVDNKDVAVTFKDTVAASTVAEQNGYFKNIEAANVVRRIASELGVDLPPLTEELAAQNSDGIAPYSTKTLLALNEALNKKSA
jgi:hypothetical protein